MSAKTIINILPKWKCRGVRAESCWAGVDVVSSVGDTPSAGKHGGFWLIFQISQTTTICIFVGSTDQLVGICDGGKLYIVHNADKMNYAE